MKKVIRIGSKRKPKLTPKEKYLTSDFQARVEMIQVLIPIGLMSVAEQIAGARYSRQGGLPCYYRWGSDERSVYLADQKVRTLVPRV